MRRFKYDPAKAQKHAPRLAKALRKVLATEGAKIAAQLRAVAKSEADDLLNSMDFGAIGNAVGKAVNPVIEAAHAQAATDALVQVGAAVDVRMVNQQAVAYAEERGAELVTQIADSTRDKVRALVVAAVENGASSFDLADEIEGAQLFGAVRADLIASYELGQAMSQGNLQGWKDSGVVSGKGWATAGDEIVSDGCSMNEQQGIIGIDELFQSGDSAPLAHPMCRCSLYGAEIGKYTTLSGLEKFNPNHDEKGRFTSEGSATFVSTTNLRAVERMKLAHENKQNPIVRRGGIEVKINDKGVPETTKNGEIVPMNYGEKIVSVKELRDTKSASNIKLADAVEAKGFTHIMGSKVPLHESEASAIMDAVNKHPATKERKAEADKNAERMKQHDKEEAEYKRHYNSIISAMTLNGRSK